MTLSCDGLKAVWRDGRAALGAFLFLRTDPVAAEAIADSGFDYVCIDMQHGYADGSDTVALLQALSLGSTVPVVRVPWNSPDTIGRVLDAGALGVIVPMVNTPEDAARAVAACRYAPAGIRSYGPVRAGITFGSGYFDAANDRVACIPMIETRQAVENVEDILAVPGIDAVYIGPTDLSVSYGLAPAFDHDGGPFAAALERVLDACPRRGVVPGIHATGALASKRLAAGFRMVTVANDLNALLGGLRRELLVARGETSPRKESSKAASGR
jgi:4-hydroxy-2-oxoheptanedioate aldolase